MFLYTGCGILEEEGEKEAPMNIKMYCVYDRQAVTALMRTGFSKGNPKSSLLLNWGMQLAMVALGLLFIWGQDEPTLGWILIGLAGVLFALITWIYFGIPKMQYKSMCKFADIRVDFAFGPEAVVVDGGGDSYKEHIEMPYQMLHKAIETSTYLFIYIDKKRAYIVNKATAAPEEMAQVRGVLQSVLGAKYEVKGY